MGGYGSITVFKEYKADRSEAVLLTLELAAAGLFPWLLTEVETETVAAEVDWANFDDTI